MDSIWFEQVIREVEESITEVIENFRTKPYLHRVEHCLHNSLISRMLTKKWLSDECSFGNSSYGVTRLVHKEWPAKHPSGPGRRGNFDISILDPEQIRQCNKLSDFKRGKLSPVIAIELGLNYGKKHLENDYKKLKLNVEENNLKAGYLIHLVRDRRTTLDERDYIEAVLSLSSTPIKLFRHSCIEA